MDLNATLLGQILTFMVLVWFTMKYIWPPVTQAMAERSQRIADGLAAAERGVRELELAQAKAKEQLRDAKIQSAELLEKTNNRAKQIIEDAKKQASKEGEAMLSIAKAEIAQEMQRAKETLRQQVANVVIAGAEQVLGRNIDATINRDIFADLVDKM